MSAVEPARVALEARSLVSRRGRSGESFELQVDSLRLHAGEVLVVLGPNGAGKSTLLRALAGLDDSVDRRAVHSGAGPVTLVFQRPAAFAGSVVHNAAASLLGRGVSAQERAVRARRALDRFGIAHLSDHDARTLSGGELRRLALARAFVLEPAVLLLDEPFDDLDAEGQRSLSLDLDRAIEETGVAVAMVTHDLRRALLMADRIAVLTRGRLAQEGPRDDVLMHPGSPEIARTVGMSNLAEGRVRRQEGRTRWVEIGEGLEVPTEVALEVGQSVWIGIRPEHLKIDVGRGEGLAIGEARVESLLSDGLATVVALRAKGHSFTTHLLAGRGLARRLERGDVVPLAVAPRQVHARPLAVAPRQAHTRPAKTGSVNP